MPASGTCPALVVGVAFSASLRPVEFWEQKPPPSAERSFPAVAGLHLRPCSGAAIGTSARSHQHGLGQAGPSPCSLSEARLHLCPPGGFVGTAQGVRPLPPDNLPFPVGLGLSWAGAGSWGLSLEVWPGASVHLSSGGRPVGLTASWKDCPREVGGLGRPGF